MENKAIQTEFGTARLFHGHYRIDSYKEGNHNKYLHRLIWENHYNKPVPEGYVIHHINGIRTDNRIQNLQCVPRSIHTIFHRKGKNHSEEHRKKMSESHKGKIQTKKHCLSIAKGKNTTGYYRVSKVKSKDHKQGFKWVYQFRENGKYYSVTAINLDKLKKKVLAKNWIWGTLEEVEGAIQ